MEAEAQGCPSRFAKKNCPDLGNDRRGEIIEAITAVAREFGDVSAACDSAGVSRATYYRRCKPKQDEPKRQRPAPRRALTPAERTRVLDVLHEPRFVDKAPGQVYATLLDEGVYLCSIRTMYRILAANDEVRERRRIARHPKYAKPVLLATKPNEVWSWDITKLKGPHKWNHYHLYVIMDIFSRKVVGWMVAYRENAQLAKELIARTCKREKVDREKLIIHSDRGSAMTSKTVAQLLMDLGVIKSLSRPHVSNDNPFSEAGFKTLKYFSAFPENFGSIQDARAFCEWFFHYYNNEHRHSGIALMTPAMVHHGLAESCNQLRAAVLTTAFTKNPERFVKGQPKPLAVPEAVWINPPDKEKEQAAASTSDSTDRKSETKSAA